MNLLVSGLTGFMLGMAVIIWGSIIIGGERDPFSQANFPCAEDEALIYAPQFGPDRVGCMHIEGSIAPEVWELTWEKK